MKDIFGRLAQDFFSTIVFLAIYLITDNVILATAVAIAGAIGQVIYARYKDRRSARGPGRAWASSSCSAVPRSSPTIRASSWQSPRSVILPSARSC